MTSVSQAPAHHADFADQFTPKLITVLREDCGSAQFRAAAVAGPTVAIIALVQSIAMAIVSDAAWSQGLYITNGEIQHHLRRIECGGFFQPAEPVSRTRI